MAQVKYIAFLSNEPGKLANFYCTYLDMKEIQRTSDGDIIISDGFYSLSIFKPRSSLDEARLELGLHHIGLKVDDLDTVLKKYRAFNPRGLVIKERRGPEHGEYRILDPEGNPILLSNGDYGIASNKAAYPRIVHVALNAYLPQGLLDFYTQVFGFREVGQSHVWRSRGKMNRFAGDGHTNLAIHPFIVDEFGHEGRFGINHIGFLTDQLDKSLARLDGVVDISKRPDNRPYAEYRLRDPDGNMFDLAQSKGWEIDLEKWDLVG